MGSRYFMGLIQLQCITYRAALAGATPMLTVQPICGNCPIRSS